MEQPGVVALREFCSEFFTQLFEHFVQFFAHTCQIIYCNTNEQSGVLQTLDVIYGGFARRPCCMAGIIDYFSYGRKCSNAKHFRWSCHATWLPCKTSFYDKCRNSRELIGLFLSVVNMRPRASNWTICYRKKQIDVSLQFVYPVIVKATLTML